MTLIPGSIEPREQHRFAVTCIFGPPRKYLIAVLVNNKEHVRELGWRRILKSCILFPVVTFYCAESAV